MEQFPNFTNQPENKNKFIEGLRKKLNIAVLYGSISLTALVAAGCGSKIEQAEANAGASRFPKAEEVIKSEKNGDAVLNKALDDISYHRYKFEQDGSLIVELHGAKWRVEKKNVDIFKSMANRTAKDLSSSKSEFIKDSSYKALQMKLDMFIEADGTLLDGAKMTETKSEKIEGGVKTETTVRHIEPSNIYKEKTPPKTNQIKTSPDFDSQPNIKGGKEVNLDNF